MPSFAKYCLGISLAIVTLIGIVSQTNTDKSSSHQMPTSNAISATSKDDICSLYIYYNDTVNFVDIDIESFKSQIQSSIKYALQSIHNFTINHIDGIDICSFYQHSLSDVYITNECKESLKWKLSQQQLTANGAQSAVSIHLNINKTSLISTQSVMDSINNMNESMFTEYFEECINMEITDELCTNSKYKATGDFDIINIENELIMIKIEDKKQEKDLMFWLRKIGGYLYDYCIYGIMCICLMIAFIAWIHAICNGYDCINIMALIIYAIYVMDFYADVIFCTHLVREGYIWLAVGSGSCVIIPLCTQIGALLIYQEQWIRDQLLREKISGWLMLWSRKLLIFAFVSGSSYGAVELLNSNIFAMQFFSMGLTKKHLSQFNGKRLVTTVLLENIPQLIIQCLYMFKYENYYYLLDHYMNITSIDIVLMTAFISSLISICTALINLCATRTSYKIQSKDEYIFWMLVESNDEIESKMKQCIYRRKSLAKGLKKVLSAKNIEISLCYRATEGIVVAFNVYVDKTERDQRSKAKLTHQLNAAANFGELEGIIENVWKLNDVPLVTVLTKSGCIPEIKSLSEIASYDEPRKSKRNSSKLSLTVNLGELGIFTNDDGTPNLAPLGSQRVLSPNNSDDSMTTINIDILSPHPFIPVLSATPSTIYGDNTEIVHFDTEPYAL